MMDSVYHLRSSSNIKMSTYLSLRFNIISALNLDIRIDLQSPNRVNRPFQDDTKYGNLRRHFPLNFASCRDLPLQIVSSDRRSCTAIMHYALCTMHYVLMIITLCTILEGSLGKQRHCSCPSMSL